MKSASNWRRRPDLVYALSGFLLLSPGSASADQSDRIVAVCQKGSSRECVSLCRKFGLKGSSQVIYNYCSNIVRTDEQKAMKGDNACAKSTCIYRLSKVNDKLYRGGGYSIAYTGFEDMGPLWTVTDPRKRKTVFWQGGTGKFYSWKRGPLKSAEVTETARGFIIKVRRSE